MFHKIHNLITLTAAWILMAAIHAFMGFTLFQWTAGAVLVDIVINASTFVLMGIGLGHFISART